jgi:molecular chaperone DnaK (HSP70)
VNQSEKQTKWGYGIPSGQEAVKWFKLLLLDDSEMQDSARHSKQIERARILLQKAGKTPIEAVADYLQFLWEHTMAAIKEDPSMGEHVVEGTPFQVVITVPAVWSHNACRKMTKAAAKAGILAPRLCGDTTLSFVSEPEAAALATFQDLKSRPDLKVRIYQHNPSQ